MIGQTINDRYQIEALLGRGGMGSVYRATDLIQNRVVALKFLDLYRGEQTETALTRFQREFRVLTRLNHPRIVQAYEFGTYNNIPYLVLEFLAGSTLTTEIATAPFSRARSLQLASQICEPLAYLHTQSIVHRDLKPDNLMLVSTDNNLTEAEVKLMDFGLVHQADFSMQLTQEGLVLGTVAYMAPEQAQGFPIDFRADLYALGAILYQMVTGRPPFMPDNPAVMLMKLLTSTPPAPRQLNPDIDQPLEQLVMHLLAKEPSERPPNTEEVAARLVELANETVSIPVAPTTVTSGPGRIDLIPRVPLIGREAALTQLLQFWTVAQSGHGQVVLLSGLAGIGKTRLLEEARPQVRLEQGWIVRSYCQDQAALPYQPVINILEALLHRLPATVSESLPPELVRLLPNTNTNLFDDADSIDQAEARRRLFMACWDVVKQATDKQALKIVIEDLQWADPATLELLDYLINQVDQTRLLLVLTYRSEEFNPATSLAALRRDVGYQQVAHRIELNLLSRDQVAHFLQRALGWNDVPEWLIDKFYQTTDGNPLFIEETLKALAAEGQVAEWKRQESSLTRKVSVSSLNLQLPQNVLDLAQRRLKLLSDEDRTILTAAAILGPEFSFVLLETITKLTEDDLLDTIERLLAARFIQELPLQDGEDRYRFVQEALRQALLNTISRRRSRLLHRRAGQAIQAIYDTGQRRTWPVLAHHFAMAGQDEQALKYFILAGDAAAQVYANTEAVGYYSRALEIAKQGQDDATKKALSQLCTRLGRALELDSRYEQALSHYEDMGTLAHKQGDRFLELTALLARITLYATVTPAHDPAQAEVLAEDALALARDLGNQTAEVKILWNLVNIYGFSNRVSQAINFGEQALALARTLNLQEQIAFILTDMGRFCMMSGRIEQSKVFLNEAGSIWKALDNLPLLTDSLNVTILLNIYLAEYDQALAVSEETYQISLSIDNIWGQAYSQYKIGQIYWDRGQTEQAIKIMEEAIHLSELSGFTTPQVITRADLAAVYSDLGAFDRALEIVHTALNVAEARMPSSLNYILAALAQTHLQCGNLNEAQVIMSQIKEASTPDTIHAFFIPTILADGEFLLQQGDAEKATNIIDNLITTLHESNMKVYLPQALYLHGQALLALGQEEEGHNRLLKARLEAETIGSQRILWQILATLAEIEVDPEKAERLRQEAREIIQYIAVHAPAYLRTSFLALPKVQMVK